MLVVSKPKAVPELYESVKLAIEASDEDADAFYLPGDDDS